MSNGCKFRVSPNSGKRTAKDKVLLDFFYNYSLVSLYRKSNIRVL